MASSALSGTSIPQGRIPIKILFVNSLYHPHFLGGAERIVQSLAEGLVKAGHQAVVVSTAPRRRLPEQINGVTVYYLEGKNLYWPFGGDNPLLLKPLWHLVDTYNPLMARELGRLLDAERPSLVHTNNLAGFSVAVWHQVKARNLPLVHTLMDYYLLCPRSKMYKAAGNCDSPCRTCSVYGLPRRRMSNLVDAAIGLSAFVLRRHERFGYFARTPIRRVIYSGYHAPTSLTPLKQNPNLLRFGYLGRLHPTKGIESVLRSLVSHAGKRWELWIAGKGSPAYEAQLKGSCTLPNVRYVGFVRPEEFLTSVDALVVPSVWNEPFGMTVIEAYAHGVPVIGSCRGGLAEIIENGETGFLFDPTGPASLEEILGRLIAAPVILTDMRARVLEKARDFSPQRMVDDYLRLYGEVTCVSARRVRSGFLGLSG
jgi:glycosyltransferase involved in cell wall biosynthesis